MPFYSCENELLVRNIKHGSISYNTLLKYMNKLTQKAEEKVRLTQSDKFGLVLDGCNSGDVRYVSVFATFPIDNTNE